MGAGDGQNQFFRRLGWRHHWSGEEFVESWDARLEDMLSALVFAAAASMAQAGSSSTDHPCRDVLPRSRAEQSNEAALRVLGACLASRHSAETHLRVVAEMAQRSLDAGDERGYCRFGKLLGVMLDDADTELFSSVREQAESSRDAIACGCDRQLVDARVSGLDRLDDEFDPLWRPRWQPETPVRTILDETEHLQGTDYRILVNQQRGNDRYCLFRDGELRYAVRRESLEEGFLESTLFTHDTDGSVHAIVRWMAGSGGETLQFVDLTAGETMREYRSRGQVNYRLNDGRVAYSLEIETSDGERQRIDGSY